jgi:hypothetical protein
LSPAFASAPCAGAKTNVFDYPVNGVGKGRQQKEARKKQAEQDPENQYEGMDAEPLNGILRLAKYVLSVFHCLNPEWVDPVC